MKTNNRNIIIVVALGVFISVSAAVFYYFVFWNKKVEPVIDTTPVVAETPKKIEPDFEGINPEMPKVVVEKPPAVIEKDIKKTEKSVAEAPAAQPTAPSNNKKPKVNILSYGLSDRTHDNDKGISISARAEDSDGYISKVEIYIDDEKQATVLPRNIGGKSKTLLDDPEDIFDITEDVGNAIQEDVDDGDISYVYRDSKEWTKASESCGVSKGFVHIFVGESKYYDVRSTEDLDENVICYESETISVDNLYYFMWQPENGSHDVYAIAYDQYGAKTTSETIEIEVD